MGQNLNLTAIDGHTLAAYRADPENSPRGGVVVIQEIFGVNIHIRDVCDRYAEAGFTAIAPALFDRHQRDVDLGYDEDGFTQGRIFKAQANDQLDKVLLDVEAARQAISDSGKTGIVGYCWGGVVVWAAACRSTFAAASSYYGAGIVSMRDETPQCPVMMHFGAKDASIAAEDIAAIGQANSQANPAVEIFTYAADHGFNCDRRSQFDAQAAQLAGERTLALFNRHVAG